MLRYKIVLVPFPFDDLISSKVRPALCLTDAIGFHKHVIVAFITSQIPQPLLDSDLVLDSSNPEFSITGLKLTSTFRLHRLITLDSAIIQRILGDLPETLLFDLRDRLRSLFDLSV